MIVNVQKSHLVQLCNFGLAKPYNVAVLIWLEYMSVSSLLFVVEGCLDTGNRQIPTLWERCDVLPLLRPQWQWQIVLSNTEEVKPIVYPLMKAFAKPHVTLRLSFDVLKYIGVVSSLHLSVQLYIEFIQL